MKHRKPMGVIPTYTPPTMFDQKGVAFLSMSVIEQSYKDYIFDAKVITALKDPFRSKNTFKRFNKLFDSTLNAVKKEVQKGHKEYVETDPQATISHTLAKLEDEYYDSAQRLIDNGMFMQSDRFHMFAHRIDGKWLQSRAEEFVKDWADGKPVTYATHLEIQRL